ncbi:unnamed protein product [Withania somnifera]
MSGGFFRGTSAEQDTRFSNKQAKLLKSQKFAPELEHLVDMTKVKMDVMKPWIAKRVTELIGFEDEVLINFIYSLLERKVVNGKEVQISLTGFMERNTGKFMKELWVLLLSAQNNAGGVPQLFLEAKEEEMRKKKAEMDRIANEIQKKKERECREMDQEKRKKMDNYDNNSPEKNAAREPTPKHQLQVRLMDNLDPVERNGSRSRNRISRSPRSADHSPSPRRSRSISKSLSNSRSYSRERLRSQSTSRSREERRGRSLSSERVYRSPPRCSISPRRKHSPRRSLCSPRHGTKINLSSASKVTFSCAIPSCEKCSPARHVSPVITEVHKLSRSSECRRPISSVSLQKNPYDRKDSREKEMPLPLKLRRSPSVPESPRHSRSDSGSPPTKRERSHRGLRSISNRRERKTIDTDRTSPSKLGDHRVSSDISEKIADEKEMNHSREAFEHKSRSSRKLPTTPDPHKDLGKGWDEKEFSKIHCHSDLWESRKRSEVIKSEKLSGRMEHAKELDQQKSPSTHSHSHSVRRLKESYDGKSFKEYKENLSQTNVRKGKELHVESETPLTSSRNVEQNDLSSNEGSGFEESEKRRAKLKEKRKQKRPARYESMSDDSFDSDVEDRKEAKRRRKEERRLKKEEKRRRREERRRRKEERRSQKLKLNSANVICSPSDRERNPDSHASDDEHLRKEDQHGHEIEESESLQKRLEIELREKALESLRAKKGISH